jgi:outer membrane protein OmpA-like peptidoglycan-associated protein
MGKCYHLNEDLEKAKEYYQQYLDLSSKKNALYPWAELGLTQVAVAEKEMGSPKNYELKNLGNIVNTEYPEYSPVVSLDGTALFYTSRRLWADSTNFNMKDLNTNFYWEDIYVSYKDFDDTWMEPIMLDFCRPNQNEATVSVSADERKVYVYNDIAGNGDIFYSKFESNIFTNIDELDVPKLNSSSWETHLTVTPDGRTIYFVSDREGGFGGRDIYRIVKLPNGKWSEPINLGETINTEFDEDSPFMAVDNKTLYFASNGVNSMGGFDIFMSVRDEFDNWSTPINLGYPLNSTGDDIFYTTTMDGMTGYLTSFRRNGEGDKDIYEIRNNFLGKQAVSVLKGEIVVAGNKPLPEDISVTVNCLNCGENNSIRLFPRLRDGIYFSKLEKCREYELIYTYNDGKTEFHRDVINTNCDNEFEELHQRVLLRLDDMTIIPFMKYTLAGTVADFVSHDMLENVKVEFLNDNGTPFETVMTDSEGAFKSTILDSSFYGDQLAFTVRLSKEGYLTQKFDVNQKLGKEPHIQLTYLIDKPDVGKDLAEVLELNPIYFDLDKSDIRPDAEIELNKIVTIMNDNPTIKIELGSHTDCRGSASYNMSLSDRRAKSSAEYIRKRISDPSRIFGKGYGESKLVNHCECEGDTKSDCSEEEHQMNRRTEFIITDE